MEEAFLRMYDKLRRGGIQILEQMLSQLKELRERQLLRFRLTEGLSYEEIARRTGQSPKALRVAFHRIKDKLKRQI